MDTQLDKLHAQITEMARKLGLQIYPAGIVGGPRAFWVDGEKWSSFLKMAPMVGASVLYLVVDPPGDPATTRPRFGRDDEEMDVPALHAAYVSPQGVIHALEIFDQTGLEVWDAAGETWQQQRSRTEELERRAGEEGWTEKILFDARFIGCPRMRTRWRVVGDLLAEFDPSISRIHDTNLIFRIAEDLELRLPDAKGLVEQRVFDTMPELARELQHENPKWESWRVPVREAAAKKFLAARFGFYTTTASGELARYKVSI
ncbi:MAG: hypothetical protein ACYDEY_15070 [Acidimicrobiales bacterium]